MAKDLSKFYRQPCADCGHTDMHGEVAGCIALASRNPDRWCPCDTYKAPAEAKVARVIPSRRTDPGTSHQADRAIVIKANTQRGRLLATFGATPHAENGHQEGLTDEEAMNLTEGVSPYSEYAKRCSELRDAGLIETTGETRKGQAGTPRIVSRITDAGRAALAAL